MELTGEEMIAQPIQIVWDSLNDPEILKACISGCEEIAIVADNEYKVELMAAVGPVKARFNGKLLLSDIVSPTSYSLTFKGSGGAAGFANGSAQVSLSQEGRNTKLAYNVNAKVGGKIAQVGSRLIEGVARKFATDFFSRFSELVAKPGLTVELSTEKAAVVHKSERNVPTALWIVLTFLGLSLLVYFLH